MTTTGLEVFDRAVHQGNDWLKDIMYEMTWDDRHRAYLGLRSVLQTLRDRLTPDEAVHLGAQLPLIVRGFYYEGWKPSTTPEKIRNRDQFLQKVAEPFNGNAPDVNAEDLVRAVFKLLAHRISQGEIDDIRSILPEEIGDLWPHPVP